MDFLKIPSESISSFENLSIWVVLGCAFIGILYGIYLIRHILVKDAGSKKMQEIAKAIQEGARTYLNRQFKTIVFFTIILGVLLYLTAIPKDHFTGRFDFFDSIAIGRMLAFFLGAFFSALVGFVGMSLAVRANVRTAHAAKTSFQEALTIAFRSGSVAGMFTVGLGLLGATVIFLIFREESYEVLIGFGFGGCMLALFMRVGGGIFTKAADIGADLVGKVEAGIPEDDPRNAAVIADNVGDNVGDCAGMAADIFESYEVTLVASMILGLAAFPGSFVGVFFPLLVRGVGVLTSIFGTYVVKAGKKETHAMRAINRGFIISAVLSAVGFFYFAYAYVKDMRVFWATVVGLCLAVVISLLTEHFTSTKRKPVKEIAAATKTGTATNILSGIAVGMESSVWAILVIALSIFVSVLLAGANASFSMILYLISLVGMGMLTTTGVIIAMDSFGPVADNAQGIIEMSKEGDEKTSRIIAGLDAVGNTTKAITKGFAIASAVIAATSLFGSYFTEIGKVGSKISAINISSPVVFIGLLIGGAVPFLFSSFTIRAVGRTASEVINEVRRQFREIKGLMEGKAQPEYTRCVDICTRSALRELISPGILAIVTPILVGFVFKEAALGAYLAGTILVGQLLAVFLANSGGAWDNAKKTIEDGLYGGKGSDCHKAAVVGDTVGDPFKDTAGPALNPLIKVMNLVALIIAPLVVSYKGWDWRLVVLVCCGLILLVYAIWSSKRSSFKLEGEGKAKAKGKK